MSTKTGKQLMRTNSIMSRKETRAISSSRSQMQKHDLMLSTLSADDFFIDKLVGTGAHADVYKSKHKKTGDVVAIKRIHVSNEETRDTIRQEITILEGCNHQNIVRYRGCFFQNEEIWIVMDFCEVGSTLDIRRRYLRNGFSEDQLSAILYGILMGLDYLHHIGKIHRDMKSGNVLLNDEGEIKIADFGVSCQLDNSKVHTVIGTPLFMSPEVIEGAPYDSSADMWSLGITAIEMVEGEPPRIKEHTLKAMLQITRDPPPTLQQPTNWSPELNDFIQLCLQKNPGLRPSAQTLLAHPFIKRLSQSQRHKILAALVQQVLQEQRSREQASEQAERDRNIVPAIDAYLTSLVGKVFPTIEALMAAIEDLKRFNSNLTSLSDRISAGGETVIAADQVASLRERLKVAQTALKSDLKQQKKSRRRPAARLSSIAHRSLSGSRSTEVPRVDSSPLRAQSSSSNVEVTSEIPKSSSSTRLTINSEEHLAEEQIQALTERVRMLENETRTLRQTLADHLARCTCQHTHSSPQASSHPAA
jgi:serine/threonine protein kinase